VPRDHVAEALGVPRKKHVVPAGLGDIDAMKTLVFKLEVEREADVALAPFKVA